MMSLPLSNQHRPATVLVVDDVPSNLDVLVSHLEQENVELVVALSGEEGLALARETHPDLILLDIMMPGIDGYETCRRLKQDPDTADIPVVFLSARNDEVDIEKGLSLGAVDYINKPFSMPILRARLRNHLALKYKNDMLTEMACTDALTGVANRRHFDLILEREWARRQREPRPFSIVMIDVDHFKTFNDDYGHGEGDRCLRLVARTLVEVLHRPADLLARYGGEEFIALLPETEHDDALTLAEHMRQSVFDLGVPHQQSSCAGQVSISLGISSADADQGISLEELLKQADDALYRAKRSGRNKVCSTKTPDVPDTN